MKNGFLSVELLKEWLPRLHFFLLPGLLLICILLFMAGNRRRGRFLLFSFSAALSLNPILKNIFKVSPPWLYHVEDAPLLAEGGYAFPCLYSLSAASVLFSAGLSSGRRSIRFICAAGICSIGFVRAACGAQSVVDVLAGVVLGAVSAVLLYRFWYMGNRRQARLSEAVVLLSALVCSIVFKNGRGLGLWLGTMALEGLEKVFLKADKNRSGFGIIYGSLFGAGIFTGLYIFLPFLIEWLVTPLWPGQALIVFLITIIPCLLKVFPLF